MPANLDTMTRADLLALYNAKAVELGLRQLSAFKTHAAAVERTRAVLAQAAPAADTLADDPPVATAASATTRIYHDNDHDRAVHRGFASAEQYRDYRNARNAYKHAHKAGDAKAAATHRAEANRLKRLARASARSA